ncbi:hypothetical protein [Nitrososphaera viennensis]|uniref:Uncharacterized protein n=2 Tax=Nitrososphaera viennensis TaxID=1034015 RepID=A0A060HIG7_9ARCH|nr:hypothetical protein [Nitrososphaera viennensis]AIC15105.1 hypothetical protein NVIE_008820 [Nitrososphaera viennensis EN76]UVS70029.1 hypothetical protein NWT39_04390 [Nitrososphaera viennensis]
MAKNARLVIAKILAAATLALVLPFFAGGVPTLQAWLLENGFGPALQAGLPPVLQQSFAQVFGLSAIVLATTAFVVSLGQRSFLVAGLLAASGVIFMIPAIMATGYFAVIVFPGPIIGVILGLGIFGLGIAKSVRTAMATPLATALR